MGSLFTAREGCSEVRRIRGQVAEGGETSGPQCPGRFQPFSQDYRPAEPEPKEVSSRLGDGKFKIKELDLVEGIGTLSSHGGK